MSVCSYKLFHSEKIGYLLESPELETGRGLRFAENEGPRPRDRHFTPRLRRNPSYDNWSEVQVLLRESLELPCEQCPTFARNHEEKSNERSGDYNGGQTTLTLRDSIQDGASDRALTK